MENFDQDALLLQIDSRDNVAVLKRAIAAGTVFTLLGVPRCAPVAMALGHKIALLKIRTGEKIIKYGVSIGSATADISAGDHVHVHNLKSDYLPTYTFDGGCKYDAH